MLSNESTIAADPTRRTAEVLGYIESAVWFPNNQGRIKRADTIKQTLSQVRANTVHTYRATLFSFFSAFEEYLATRVSHLKSGKQSWGPFVRSMSHDDLRRARYPIMLRTVLCADVSRLVRNKMLHQGFVVPTSPSDPVVAQWKAGLRNDGCEAGWPEAEVVAEVQYAADQVVGQAVSHVQDAKANGKQLPIELFYMLFCFTNLDSLAFEIEEALSPEQSRPGGEITRKRAAVRRADLILGPARQR